MEKKKLTFKERLGKINFFYLKDCGCESEETLDDEAMAKLDRQEKITLGVAAVVIIILFIVLFVFS